MSKKRKKYNLGDLVTLVNVNSNHNGNSYRSYDEGNCLKYIKGATGEIIWVGGKTINVKFSLTNPAGESWREIYTLWEDEISVVFSI